MTSFKTPPCPVSVVRKSYMAAVFWKRRIGIEHLQSTTILQCKRTVSFTTLGEVLWILWLEVAPSLLFSETAFLFHVFITHFGNFWRRCWDTAISSAGYLPGETGASRDHPQLDRISTVICQHSSSKHFVQFLCSWFQLNSGAKSHTHRSLEKNPFSLLEY